MAERSRKRHERKLARQQALLATNTSTHTSTSSSMTAVNDRHHRRPVFAPTERDLEQVDQLTSDPKTNSSSQPSHANPKLNRGKSLRDKVEAALGRWNSINPKKAGRSQSVSALDASKTYHQNDPPMVERKEGLGALARRISKKLTIEDQERRRRERLEMAYVGQFPTFHGIFEVSACC